LHHFHGPQWSGLFRDLLRGVRGGNSPGPGLPPELMVQPIETGILEYRVGETISLGLVVPTASCELVARMLAGFNDSPASGHGHFQPGVTIRLESVTSRLTGQPWHPDDPPSALADMDAEIDQLCRLDRFSIETLSPIRISRPGGSKIIGHGYCDADFFLLGDPAATMSFLLTKLDLRRPSDDALPTTLVIGESALAWLDISYGVEQNAKTLGGVVGVLQICGRPSREEAERLVWGQYGGLGKNRAFGLGFYRIPHLASVRRVHPVPRATTLFHRAISESALSDALNHLSDSSPGPDRMSLADAMAAGPSLLQSLRDQALVGPTGAPVPLHRCALPKPSGGHRFIHIQNMGERILHRAFADTMTPSFEDLLSTSAYAYRRGLSRKNAARTLKELLAEGYCQGIKADIATFFDSVNTKDLCALLTGLFPDEPLVEHLSAWLQTVAGQGVPGLPQGWALSPPLSNLYLDRFDRAMEREGFRLVRFADDFVVLFRCEGDGPVCVKTVENALSRLGLALNPDKTQAVSSSSPIPFLGYLVSAGAIEEARREKEAGGELWEAVFCPEWRHGLPVYLTSICRGTYSNGPHLVVNQNDDRTESIPWGRVSRLVIVGRSAFSGGVIYRAMREKIPVTFIDVMGRVTGHLNTPEINEGSFAVQQLRKFEDQAWTQDCSRRVVAAKIHNCAVLLRRNKIEEPLFKELEQAAMEAVSVESLRGIEGQAAKIYFGNFAALAVPFEFTGRSYHPPDGPVNVLLSFGYTLLYNRLAAVIHDQELNPRLGFFHAGRGRHAALASDLMEPLRHIVDRVVLSLIHLREITPDHFVSQERGEKLFCRMSGEGFRTYINRYEKTMASRFSPAKGGEKISYNQWLDEAVADLRRSISFDIPIQALRIF
jgi:CRISPR-associated endonuclease Cas1